MSLPTILLILAGISIGATVIAGIVALRSDREARSAIFPIVREEESVRARRARISIFGWLALTALFLGGWLATLGLEVSDEPQLVAEAEATELNQTIESTPTPVISQAATVPPSPTAIFIAESVNQQPTHTVEPTATTGSTPSSAPRVEPSSTPVANPPTATFTSVPPTNTATATPPPTATSTATSTPAPPTVTPTSLADVARIPTLGPRTPAPPQVKMGPIEFATDITSEIEPINPDKLFPEGTEAIYAVYPYSGMEQGLDFTAVWYKNGVEFVRDQEEWAFGDEFRSYRFLKPDGEGIYKLELYVNDSVLATALFEIR